MEGVTVVDHPLVQHKLTLIRDKNRSTKSFRELLKEIGMLLCYEVTRDLPLTDVEIETPLARMIARRIAGKKLVFAPVLRAGMTFAEGMLDLVPAARVAGKGDTACLPDQRASRHRADAWSPSRRTDLDGCNRRIPRRARVHRARSRRRRRSSVRDEVRVR